MRAAAAGAGACLATCLRFRQKLMLKKSYLLIYVLLAIAFFDQVARAQTDKQLVAAGDANDAQRWREDLRYMYEEIPKQHRNLFHFITRHEFEKPVMKSK